MSDKTGEEKFEAFAEKIASATPMIEQGGSMNSSKSVQITPLAALRLVDLIQEQVRMTDCELAKKILLRAGIKIADLGLLAESASRRIPRAA